MALLSGAAVQVTAVLPARAVADVPCEIAQRLAIAGFVDAALAAYAGQQTCPGESAAVTELKRRMGERDAALARAEQALQKTPPDRGVAHLAYVDALAADAGSEPARAGLATLTGHDQRFEGARILLEAGFEKEAADALTKVLAEGNPLPADARYDGLRALGEPSGLAQARAWARDRRDDAIAVLTGGLLAFVLMNWLILNPYRRRGHDGAEPTGRAARRWHYYTRPLLRVTAGEGDHAKVFAKQLQAQVLKLALDDGSHQPEFATYPETTLGLAALGDLDARLKPLVVLLRGRDSVTVTASLADEDKDFKRVVVEVAAPRSRPKVLSLRHSARGVEAPTPAVVGQATGWMLIHAQEMRPRLRCENKSLRDHFDTDDAESFSAYLGGVEALNTGDIPTARALFSRALDRDPENRRAALNLAKVELQDPDPTVWARGIERLRGLLD